MSEQHLVHERSDYEKSLAQLERRIDWVPMGWQKLYFQLRRRLISVNSTARAHITLEGPWPDMEALYIDASNADSVVQGILRKTAMASRSICSECGHVGRPREMNEREVILCSPCAGLRLLEHDLEQLKRFIVKHEASAISGWIPYSGMTPRLVALMLASDIDAIAEGSGSTWHLNVPGAKAWIDQVLSALENRTHSQL